MELKRFLYDDLVNWKHKNSGKVLIVEGARQVGKTYILKKFSNENFNNVIYINLMELAGSTFISCIEAVTKWKPGDEQVEKPLHKALTLYNKDFKDDKSTIVIVDEIQESALVYSRIREFARQFNCYFIVTGSYLGKTLNKEYFLPAGDIEKMKLEPLNFREFLLAYDKLDLYDNIDLFGKSSQRDYEELKKYFFIYQKIGGYPEVVSKYIQNEDFDEAEELITGIIGIFIDESQRYFPDILDKAVFDKLLYGVAKTLLREKKGVDDLTTELSKLVYKEESGKLSKRSINNAISWLFVSHIIGYCDKSIDCSLYEIKSNNRVYFKDLGVARLFLRRTGEKPDAIKGIIAENFVYLALSRWTDKYIAGVSPWFAIYKKTDGELDFFVRSLIDYKNYGIEVKSTNNEYKTAKALLNDGKLDYLYLLKGETYGYKDDGQIITVPLYLADRIQFNYGIPGSAD